MICTYLDNDAEIQQESRNVLLCYYSMIECTRSAIQLSSICGKVKVSSFFLSQTVIEHNWYIIGNLFEGH